MSLDLPATINLLLALTAALSIHEFSHALAAEYLGDPTAKLRGRLTLNPFAHLDPIGSAIFLLGLFSRSPFIFGWGKPVPVDSYNLKNPRRDTAIIALAGPVSNLITALAIALLFRVLSVIQAGAINEVVTPFFNSLLNISIGLAVFNLFPIPPLDGSKILLGILPPNESHQIGQFLAQYGTFLLIIAIFTNAISAFTLPIANLIFQILQLVAG